MSELDIAELPAVQDLISCAFEEDIHTGDVTTNAIVDTSQEAEALWISKENGIIAGLDIARLVYEQLDPQIEWHPEVEDGDTVEVGAEVVSIKGSGRAMLTGERIALNLVQRMSGIATMTSKFVKAVESYPAKIMDTRKTVPGLRQLDKYAVKVSGGTNHRMGLYDLAMIKDNHIVAASGITKAVEQVRKYNSEIRIEVETRFKKHLRQI